MPERRPAIKPPRTYPRPLPELLTSSPADALARQGFASAAIVTHWPDIVGPEIAAHAEPIKLQWPRSAEDAALPATLVLRVEGPAAIEIQHLSAVILERVNRFFGWRAVERIAIRQAPLRGRAKPKAAPAPTAEAVERMSQRLPDIADEGLRGALARLGAAIKQA